MRNEYADIINLPHYEPKYHPRMSMNSRAAQFAPFSALVGYDDAIKETARCTQDEIEYDDNDVNLLNCKMRVLLENMPQHPAISVIFFQPDARKKGGRYESHSGTVKKYDEYESALVFNDGKRIKVSAIFNMHSSIFDEIQ